MRRLTLRQLLASMPDCATRSETENTRQIRRVLALSGVEYADVRNISDMSREEFERAVALWEKPDSYIGVSDGYPWWDE